MAVTTDLLTSLSRFVSYKAKSLFWNHYYNRLREPKYALGCGLDFQTCTETVEAGLKANEFEIEHCRIDSYDYFKYMALANYRRFGYQDGGMAGNFSEKSLEHYLAAKLLRLSRDDVFIDVACADSPAAEIYGKLYGCTVYRQDLIFPEGIHGDIIGGDACRMPLPDGFASKMALHCSLEHFEQDSDIAFVREADRVLCKGGSVCVIPLYLSERYTIFTDPVCVSDNLVFDEDATLCCVKGWRNRFGRHYDVKHLANRIRNNLGDLKMKILVIDNEKQINPICYVKFAALFQKIG